MQHTKQHFVPQVYLKNFITCNNQLNFLSLRDDTIHTDVVKNQCQKNYFYGKDLVVENYLKDIEDNIDVVFSSIKNNCIFNKNDEMYYCLLKFTAVQGIRTKLMCDNMFNNINQQLKTIKQTMSNKNTGMASKYECLSLDKSIDKPSSLFTLLSLMSDLLLVDLDFNILNNRTKIDFITSDNPVCFCNQYIKDGSSLKGISQLWKSRTYCIDAY